MNEEAIQQIFESALTKSHMSLSKVYSNQQGEILEKLGELSGKIDGIHQRQDIANGRTAKNEARIQELREEDIKLRDLVANHILWEEEKEKRRNENETWWKRNIGWYVFLGIMSLAFLVLRKIGIIAI
jgi:hypothetical protein